MNNELGQRVILKLEKEDTRKMIGILLRFQEDHQDNTFVEVLLDQIIDQFDGSCLMKA